MKRRETVESIKLKTFLDVVNLTNSWDHTKTAKLGYFDSWYKRELNKFGDGYTRSQDINCQRLIITRLLWELQDEEFCRYISEKGLQEVFHHQLNDIEVLESVDRYRSFNIDKNMLTKIVSGIKFLQRHNRMPKKGEKKAFDKVINEIYIELYSDGQIDFSARNFEVFKGIDVKRIRRCENCAKFFLAERSDTHFCSVRCGNASRQRDWQNNKRAQIAIEREKLGKRQEWNSKDFSAK